MEVVAVPSAFNALPQNLSVDFVLSAELTPLTNTRKSFDGAKQFVVTGDGALMLNALAPAAVVVHGVMHIELAR